jgi:hypothetical protein
MTDDATAAGGIQEAVISRYSALARTTLAGGTPFDCDPAVFTDGGVRRGGLRRDR